MYGAGKVKGKTHNLNHDVNHDLTFSAHTINCVCHSIRSMFRVLGIYNFGTFITIFYSELGIYLYAGSSCYACWEPG